MTGQGDGASAVSRARPRPRPRPRQCSAGPPLQRRAPAGGRGGAAGHLPPPGPPSLPAGRPPGPPPLPLGPGLGPAPRPAPGRPGPGAMTSASPVPRCSICCERLGAYGGPVTLPCGAAPYPTTASSACGSPTQAGPRLSSRVGMLVHAAVRDVPRPGAARLADGAPARRAQRLPAMHGRRAAGQAPVPPVPRAVPGRPAAGGQPRAARLGGPSQSPQHGGGGRVAGCYLRGALESCPPHALLLAWALLRDGLHATTALTLESSTLQQAVPPRGKADNQDGEEGMERDVTLVPSAPPMHVSLSTVLGGGGDLLSLEPPTWLPDSQALACRHCSAPFMCAYSTTRPLRKPIGSLIVVLSVVVVSCQHRREQRQLPKRRDGLASHAQGV